IILDGGRTYRFRLINISPNGFEVVKLVFDSVVQQLRAFAKDGATLPAWQATMRAATVRMGPGEANDFEFTPSKAGEFVLDVTLSSLGVKPKTVLQPIVVKPRGPWAPRRRHVSDRRLRRASSSSLSRDLDKSMWFLEAHEQAGR